MLTQYLAAAGIGKLILLDFDHVSLSNLQRQILHDDSRLDMLKKLNLQNYRYNELILIYKLRSYQRILDDEPLKEIIKLFIKLY